MTDQEASMMKRTEFFFIFITIIFLQFIICDSAISCVGRILNLAVDSSPDQQTVGNVLAVFINERTGTTVNLKSCSDIHECQDMVKRGDADIFISYTGPASSAIPGKRQGNTAQETYSLVKQYFIHNYSLIWLRPFGYHGPVDQYLQSDSDQDSLAAAVITRKVLNKFPVLDRVINKLSGKIDDAVLKELVQSSDSGKDKAAIKKFLKQRNLI